MHHHKVKMPAKAERDRMPAQEIAVKTKLLSALIISLIAPFCRGDVVLEKALAPNVTLTVERVEVPYTGPPATQTKTMAFIPPEHVFRYTFALKKDQGDAVSLLKLDIGDMGRNGTQSGFGPTIVMKVLEATLVADDTILIVYISDFNVFANLIRLGKNGPEPIPITDTLIQRTTDGPTETTAKVEGATSLKTLQIKITADKTVTYHLETSTDGHLKWKPVEVMFEKHNGENLLSITRSEVPYKGPPATRAGNIETLAPEHVDQYAFSIKQGDQAAQVIWQMQVPVMGAKRTTGMNSGSEVMEFLDAKLFSDNVLVLIFRYDGAIAGKIIQLDAKGAVELTGTNELILSGGDAARSVKSATIEGSVTDKSLQVKLTADKPSTYELFEPKNGQFAWRVKP